MHVEDPIDIEPWNRAITIAVQNDLPDHNQCLFEVIMRNGLFFSAQRMILFSLALEATISIPYTSCTSRPDQNCPYCILHTSCFGSHGGNRSYTTAEGASSGPQPLVLAWERIRPERVKLFIKPYSILVSIFGRFGPRLLPLLSACNRILGGIAQQNSRNEHGGVKAAHCLK